MSLAILSDTYANLRKLWQWLMGNSGVELWGLSQGKQHCFAYLVHNQLLLVTVKEGHHDGLASWNVYKPVSEDNTVEGTLRDLITLVTPQPRSINNVA